MGGGVGGSVEPSVGFRTLIMPWRHHDTTHDGVLPDQVVEYRLRGEDFTLIVVGRPFKLNGG
eukprot:669702-Hanusia_phi.AAC.1